MHCSAICTGVSVCCEVRKLKQLNMLALKFCSCHFVQNFLFFVCVCCINVTSNIPLSGCEETCAFLTFKENFVSFIILPVNLTTPDS